MPPCASATSDLKTCAHAPLGDATALLVRDVPTGTECVIGGEGFKLLTDHIPASWRTVALAEIDYEAKGILKEGRRELNYLPVDKGDACGQR